MLSLSLDLRWNNIGMIGGRALLASCQSNSTLNELQLVGNDIPDDILQTIGESIRRHPRSLQAIDVSLTFSACSGKE